MSFTDHLGITDLYCDSKSKAEILSRQLQSVLTPEDATSIPTLQGRPCPTLSGLQITNLGGESCSNRSIPQMPWDRRNTEPDPEGNCNNIGTVAIFTQSVSSGQLPQDWIDSNISPAYKKGNRHEPVNYRPISP